ncbi:MAG: urate hydroxylase PuuD [Pyrinomonadaceae bacterium]|nr:urate hydroxylase PuuD [Pyrinomonadaceae bacterium]
MRINPNLSEWINLIARWIHVFTGILWIGQTYLFTWLDHQLTAEEAALKENEAAQVWMVHSGGFYVVEKRKQAELTRRLHWFRFEAALTWLSGMVLLVLVYYMGGALVDPDVRDISVGTATAIGVGLLILAWIVYDLLCLTPLVKHEMLFAVIAYLLVVCVAYGLTHVLSGRAAYIHVGAMFGTIMAANVWMRILPGQKRMIAAMREGTQPDLALATRAKQRSKHNTFMVVPLIFTMISNHFPTASYGHEYNWLILSALILAGWIAAKFIRRA